MTGLTTIVLPIALAFISGGGLVAYFKYLESKPENRAKARQINATAETTLGEGWAKLAEKLEKRFEEEAKINSRKVRELESRVGELEDQIRINEEKHKEVVRVKDEEIERLKKRITVLETALEKATGRPIGSLLGESTPPG